VMPLTARVADVAWAEVPADVLWEEDEARLIGECTEILTRLSGKRPEGWLGPVLAESGVTPAS
jgi:hypothetical protein